MMKQAYVERIGSLVFRELPVPEPGPGEIASPHSYGSYLWNGS